MPDEQRYTRCPSCKTIFRVTPTQLAARAGKVRCGHCQAVFDGNAHLISLAPAPRPQPFEGDYADEPLGPPTITLRNARDLGSAGPGAAAGPAPAAMAPASPELAYEDRFSWLRQQRRRRTAVAYAIGVPLLALLLAGQAIFHFRDVVAARWPSTRPALTRTCELAGCAIRPLRDVGGLSIDASDLQADPAHRGLLILTATLRNRAAWSVAYPYLELTLTDAQEQTVVRRALKPAEYAPGVADTEAGLPPNGEIPVKLFVDASATTQAGYRLYLFYP